MSGKLLIAQKLRPPPALAIYEALKQRSILVRLMRYPGHPDGLRITVGTDQEIDQLLNALNDFLKTSGPAANAEGQRPLGP